MKLEIGVVALFNKREDAQAVIDNPNFREILDTIYKNMKFIIVDASQYAYGESKISPEYIDKLKDKYKLETVKVNRYNKEVEYTIVTINNIVSLVELQKLVGKFVIGLDLYLPEEIESIADSTIVIYDDYIE